MLITLSYAEESRYFNESAHSLPQYNVMIKIPIIYNRSTQYWNGESKRYTNPHNGKYDLWSFRCELYISPINRLELAIKPEFLKYSYNDDYAKTSNQGLGDLWTSIKYQIPFNPTPSTLWALRLAYKFPLAEEKVEDIETLPLGNGESELDIANFLSYTSDKLLFTIAFGYHWRKENPITHIHPNNEFHYLIQDLYHINDYINLNIGIEGFISGKQSYSDKTLDYSERDKLALILGLGYNYKKKTKFDIEFSMDVIGKNEDKKTKFYIITSHQFNLKK